MVIVKQYFTIEIKHCLTVILKSHKYTNPGDVPWINQQLYDLLKSFGAIDHKKMFAAHEICNAIGIKKAEAPPMFHTFTGYNTVLSTVSSKIIVKKQNGKDGNCSMMLQTLFST